MASSSTQQAVLQGALAGSVIGDGLWILPGQGNALAARTDDGVILINAGNRHVQPPMAEYLREQTDQRLSAIVYSHGHQQYNAAVPLWLAHNEQLRNQITRDASDECAIGNPGAAKR